MPTLYVLQSLKDNRTYVGSTRNFEVRLSLHNSDRVKSTRHRRPFKVLFTEEFETLQEARKREPYYKSGAGRHKLKEFLELALFQKNKKSGQWDCKFKISPAEYSLEISLKTLLLAFVRFI